MLNLTKYSLILAMEKLATCSARPNDDTTSVTFAVTYPNSDAPMTNVIVAMMRSDVLTGTMSP